MRQKALSFQVVVLIVVVICDQFSKWWIHQNNPQLVQLNTGVSFGWAREWGNVVVILMTLLTLGWLGIAWYRGAKKYRWPLVLLFAGGVSNLFDRVWGAGVRDWLPIPGTQIKNNLADWVIAVGLIWFWWQLMRKSPQSKQIPDKND